MAKGSISLPIIFALNPSFVGGNETRRDTTDSPSRCQKTLQELVYGKGHKYVSWRQMQTYHPDKAMFTIMHVIVPASENTRKG